MFGVSVVDSVLCHCLCCFEFVCGGRESCCCDEFVCVHVRMYPGKIMMPGVVGLCLLCLWRIVAKVCCCVGGVKEFVLLVVFVLVIGLFVVSFCCLFVVRHGVSCLVCFLRIVGMWRCCVCCVCCVGC